jgi:hypothetical protein
MDVLAKREIPAPVGNKSAVVQPIANHCTDWAIPFHQDTLWFIVFTVLWRWYLHNGPATIIIWDSSLPHRYCSDSVTVFIRPLLHRGKVIVHIIAGLQKFPINLGVTSKNWEPEYMYIRNGNDILQIYSPMLKLPCTWKVHKHMYIFSLTGNIKMCKLCL